MPMPAPVVRSTARDSSAIRRASIAECRESTAPARPAGVAIDPDQVQPFDVQRDALWPKSVVTWLILSAIFLLLSVQAVSPTRRWRLRRARGAPPPRPPNDAAGSAARRPIRRGRRRRIGSAAPVIPPDPRQHLAGPLDPSLDALRASLAPHRRRLWLRRIVRRAWIALAAVVIAEAVLWTLARFVPLEAAPVIGAAIPIIGVLALLVAVVRPDRPSARPRWPSTPKAGLGDRVSSALELAVGFPASATPLADEAALDVPADGPFDEAAETDRFVRRQRRDALAALRAAPSLFRPRFSRSPALDVARRGRRCSCRSSSCRTRRTR